MLPTYLLQKHTYTLTDSFDSLAHLLSAEAAARHSQFLWTDLGVHIIHVSGEWVISRRVSKHVSADLGVRKYESK